MSKKIVTHPDNLKYVEALFEKEDREERRSFSNHIHFINPFGIKIITNSNMVKEKWTGKWKVLQDRFSTYWDGKGEPPSWAIYFGFVVKEMEPLFYEVNNAITFRAFELPFCSDNRRLLTNYAA
jgi:hypothetical protein